MPMVATLMALLIVMLGFWGSIFFYDVPIMTFYLQLEMPRIFLFMQNFFFAHFIIIHLMMFPCLVYDFWSNIRNSLVLSE